MKFDDIDKQILTLIDTEHLIASQIAERLHLDRSRISRRSERLKRYGFLEIYDRGIFKEMQLTAEGKLLLEQLQANTQQAAMGGSYPQQAIPTLRLHALQVTYPLFRTAYSSIEPILSAKGYIFKKSGNPQIPMYEIQLSKDISLKITTKHIIAYGTQLEMPISTPTDILESIAVKANTQAVNAFLKNTGLRVQRRLDGSAIARIKYKEIAQTDSDMAHKVSEGRGYVILAIDRNTGIPIAWTDHSDTWEFESSRDLIVEESRKWVQAIEDGEIHPYADNINTKLAFKEMKNTIEQQMANSRDDRQLLHDVIVTLKEYGEKLNLHLPVLDSMLKAQQSQEQKDKATTEVMVLLIEAINKLSAKIDGMAIKPPKPSLWLRLKEAIKHLINIKK